MVIKNALLATILLLLTGCGSIPKKEVVTKIVTHEVKVPVYIECPSPPTITPPDLIIRQLSNQDLEDPGKVVQTYKATVKQLQNHIKELNKILDGYRTQARSTDGSNE